MSMTIASSAFGQNGSVPSKYTCNGSDISPPLQWKGVPSQAKSLVLIVDDPDAPDPKAPKTTWVHWVLYNLPPYSAGLTEAVTAKGLPEGALEGTNDWKRTGYGGPCPPVGQHRYFFKLYALDTVLKNLNHPSKAQVEKAMHGHVLDSAELIGLFGK